MLSSQIQSSLDLVWGEGVPVRAHLCELISESTVVAHDMIGSEVAITSCTFEECFELSDCPTDAICDGAQMAEVSLPRFAFLTRDISGDLTKAG